MFSISCTHELLPIQNKMPTILLVLNTVLFQAPDALGLVPIESVDVKVSHILPFYDLKVSQYSSLMFLLPVQLSVFSLIKWPLCNPVKMLP